MPSWNPDQYLKFNDERTQPCRDLVMRIALAEPRRIVDLGCGPGNSTEVLAERWPRALITGVDKSAEMIAAAHNRKPGIAWERADIATWLAREPADLIFSNAALHWIDQLDQVVPQLLAQLAPGGALAWQVPANINAPAHRLMRKVAGSPAWRERFPNPVREWHAHDLAFYYDLLSSADQPTRVVGDGVYSHPRWTRGHRRMVQRLGAEAVS